MGRNSLYPDRRDTVIAAIDDLTRTQQRPPSMREIAKKVDISVGTLHAYLGRLADEGLVQWQQRSARSIQLTEQAKQLS